MTMHQRLSDEALPAASPTSPSRKQWNWLRAARVAWIVLTLVLLTYFVASIPVAYQLAGTVCAPSNSTQCALSLTPGNARALARLHVAVAAYVGFLVALTAALSLLFVGIGVLIFWRKSQEWRGLFFSLVLVLFGAGGVIADGLGGISVTARTPLFLQLLVYASRVITDVQWPALFAFILIFPTGRFTPRWSWLLVVPPVVADMAPLSSDPVVSAAENLAIFLVFICTVGVQVYRYIRVYDSVQRQQTKWFIFAFAVAISCYIIYSGLGAVVPGLGAPDSWYQLLNNLTTYLILAVFPLGLGIAILRYRLWDIDVLINRTLVYGTLSALLVGLYIGLILALQALVHVVTGSLSQQPLVIVVSTLVIAALFQPLRRRLQTIIDRRFYRRKYDAVKVMAAFSSTLRQEVDLDQLRQQLLAVVQETMQPVHISLWLRQPEPFRERNTRMLPGSKEEESVPS
ncbi:MAG TPA: hypothetical protein VKR83_04460 [Ktedonobacteraceae bacterium]|nr:hypothetical protein [Ktedonobacteraceae bacterium]